MVAVDKTIARNVEKDATSNNGKSSQARQQNCDNLWCSYCKKSRHTSERCWKLHGKPLSREWVPRREQSKPQGQANVVVQRNTVPPQELYGFNKEEIDRFKYVISNLEKPSGTCSLVYLGESPLFIGLNVSDTIFSNSWIMDSGATGHMTHSSNFFLTYSPCPSSRENSYSKWLPYNRSWDRKC
ncbi:hypothetical protein FEM48_Zijuj02G0096100 [Ziziphus jujuba var. spinosa]|uniref:Uncharacterized protein n=1 Tax=Ziziphus jujuba var. spinosa TaxID=714518 RepID=A0A978VV00_ZIZJJ|nr:hypothetical protein FEM48_Zijuj02G0096100 [Ziziphus jujuba var. spinosa]